jgi:hypothetical protein
MVASAMGLASIPLALHPAAAGVGEGGIATKVARHRV